MAISAKNVQIQLNGDYVPCQLDLTLNITQIPPASSTPVGRGIGNNNNRER